MKLEHEFTVPAPIDEAWQVLLDVERVAPCMPGAALTSVDGDEFTGTVKVKVGPIQVTYKGQARFVTKDADKHRVVIEASGKEARGSGTAAATVTADLTAQGSETHAHVVTDLNITGRPAQFGRGVMADVGAKLIGQFSDCLAEELGTGSSAAGSTVASTTATSSATATSDAAPVETAAAPPLPPTASATPEAAPAPATPLPPAQPAAPRPPRREAEPIDLLDVAGGSVAKRVAPVAAAVLLLLVLLRWRRRR